MLSISTVLRNIKFTKLESFRSDTSNLSCLKVRDFENTDVPYFSSILIRYNSNDGEDGLLLCQSLLKILV